MELIDWQTVLIAMVAGTVILSAAWFLIPLGIALARKSQGVASERPTFCTKPRQAVPDDEAEEEIRQVRDR